MRSFRFVTAMLVLSGLALIGAAQQLPGTDAITGRVLGEDGNPLAPLGFTRMRPRLAARKSPIRPQPMMKVIFA